LVTTELFAVDAVWKIPEFPTSTEGASYQGGANGEEAKTEDKAERF
jgi:hypothetical protein